MSKHSERCLNWRKDNPEHVRSYNKRYIAQNHVAINLKRKERHAANPEKRRARARERYRNDPVYRKKISDRAHARYKRDRTAVLAQKQRARYKLTVDQQTELWARHNGKCHCCLTALATDVDHDHTTGHVRGALCNPCNIMLGGAKDNPSTLFAAISYLEQNVGLKDRTLLTLGPPR